ncbi:MAG TPA: GerMN domain-containing protein [Candidatus Acidoferrum sp.]|nr:GerMN domain-containing protein [Candidatus Acidoferrum sp.]
MPRNLKITLVILIVAVVIGLTSLKSLRRRIERVKEIPKTEEEVRHELLAPHVSTSSDVKTAAEIYWASGPDQLAPVQTELPLSANPVDRAKQVISALIAQPPTPEQRTLPENATLLGFYILPDGTAIADFSDALSSETPSGILSESLAVNSIVETLENNVPGLKRLKILIHGQEVDTLAGHVDLTGFFDLVPPAAPAPASTPPVQGAANKAPASAPATPSPGRHR